MAANAFGDFKNFLKAKLDHAGGFSNKYGDLAGTLAVATDKSSWKTATWVFVALTALAIVGAIVADRFEHAVARGWLIGLSVLFGVTTIGVKIYEMTLIDTFSLPFLGKNNSDFYSGAITMMTGGPMANRY